MTKRRLDISSLGKTFLVAASALSLTLQAMPIAPAWAASSKASMQMPINEKLDDAAQPQQVDDAVKPSLAPMTLQSEKPVAADPGSASDTNGDDVLKSSVTTNDFVPKGLVGKEANAAPPLSVNGGDLDAKLINNAKKVNIMPLALMESRDELDRRQEARFEAEKIQLTDLWNATLSRSPDIQFVTQKLQPSSKPGHTADILMRMTSAVLFGGMMAANMMMPNMGMYAATGMGGSMISQCLNMGQSAQAKKAHLNETETIILYNMVRGTADKLVEVYRNYKKNSADLHLAEQDFSALTGMVNATKDKETPQRQIEMEYTLRKAQRDMNFITQDVRKNRQSLIDLAGGDAVAKLDKQMDEEQMALDPAVAALTQGGEIKAVEALNKADTEASAIKSAKGEVVASDPTKQSAQ